MSRRPEVLGASALFAWLQEEPGINAVNLEGAVINRVNWSEVSQKRYYKKRDRKGPR